MSKKGEKLRMLKIIKMVFCWVTLFGILGMCNTSIAAQKRERKKIRIGSSWDLSRALRMANKPLYDGINLAFTEFNNKSEEEKGSLKDYDMILVEKDDEYNPVKTRENVEELLSQGIDILLIPTGTEAFLSYEDLIREKKVLVLFPVASSLIAARPDLPYSLPLSVSDANQLKTLLSYVAAKPNPNPKKYLFFYQNDPYGDLALKMVAHELKKAGVKEWVKVPYDPGTTRFKDQASFMREHSAQNVIGMLSTARASMSLIRQLQSPFFAGKLIFGTQILAEMQFLEFLKREQIPFAIGSYTPNYKLSDLQIAKDFNAQIAQQEVEPSLTTFAAYIAACLLIDCLQKIEGPITKEALIKVIENIKDYDFKGMLLSYDPITREVFQTIWINDNGKVIEKQVIRKKPKAIDSKKAETAKKTQKMSLKEPEKADPKEEESGVKKQKASPAKKVSTPKKQVLDATTPKTIKAK